MEDQKGAAFAQECPAVDAEIDWHGALEPGPAPGASAEERRPPAGPLAQSRHHELSIPTTRLGRVLRRMQDWLEALVVRHSVFADQPIYSCSQFPWVAGIEAEWQKIRDELDAVMVFCDRMPSFQEIILEAATITRDADWKTFFLLGAGIDCRENARRCPQTARLLQSIPGAMTAFFSILAPGKHIPAHRGAYNGLLRFHLGLIVPGPTGSCRIRVSDQMRTWTEGRSLIFDDSFNHEVWNDSLGWRVVLFVDFPRPLKRPWDRLNRLFLASAPLLPFLRMAKARHSQWVRRFYGAG